MADESEAQRRPGEFVIGREMAAALEAEERRTREGATRPLVMPSRAYDGGLGQLDLYDPDELPLDLALRGFVRAYRGLEADDRAAVRRSVSLDEAYTLITFARRAAVFSLRSADAGAVTADAVAVTASDAVADGLTACAAIELERTDPRDVLVALALLYHAAKRSGSEAGRMLAEAGSIGEPALRTLIEGFLSRPSADRNLRDGWGLVEVQTPGGIGLLQWGFRPWTPSLDLVAPAVAIGAIINADAYQAGDAMLATTMPQVWLADADDPALTSMLGAARGTVTIHARMRPDASPDHDSQQLTVFLLEAADSSAATRLVEMARHGRPETALLGVAAGPLFTLVVARSWVEGVESVEDTDSLARFSSPLANILEQFAGPSSGSDS